MSHCSNLSLGTLHLIFAKTERGTQIIQQKTEAPFKVQRPFYPEGANICHTLILHNGGGLVGGDRLWGKLQLQAQAQALITTGSATKVYRSLEPLSQQNISIEIETGACVEWLPQETIIFNGANYRQDLRVELSPGALWLGWDITRFGRTGRGERFESGNWRSHTEIWCQDSPLWIDRQKLQGGQPFLDSWQGLAGCPIVASLAFVGQPVTEELVMSARLLGSTIDHQGTLGVTRLREGLLCRYRGHSRLAARAWLLAVWHLLRLTHLQRCAYFPPFWQ